MGLWVFVRKIFSAHAVNRLGCLCPLLLILLRIGREEKEVHLGQKIGVGERTVQEYGF